VEIFLICAVDIPINHKSDKKAKLAFKEFLTERNYTNIEIVSTPVDVTAEKDGNKYFFEIKMTKNPNRYFGAATLTEWQQALETPKYFRFVVAITNHAESEFVFKEFTPAEFMGYSTVPPFKINFNINLKNLAQVSNRKKAVAVNAKRLKSFVNIFKKLRVPHITKVLKTK
jgi:hypothetical protein